VTRELGHDALPDRLVRQVFDLEMRHFQPVLASLIYLKGGTPGVHLKSVPSRGFGGFVNQRTLFTSFGLAGSRAEYYLERPEPLAWGLAAAMEATRYDRDELRKACLERIGASSIPPEQKQLLGAFVEAGR
jgi:hypothetical protein